MGPIHPRDKKPLGVRLAQEAAALVYGVGHAVTGPTLAGCTVQVCTCKTSPCAPNDHMCHMSYCSTVGCRCFTAYLLVGFDSNSEEIVQ
jgi:hypothetical protein